VEDDGEKRGLLAACLAWQPGDKRLEHYETVQPYLNKGKMNLQKLRLLEHILAKYRKPNGDGNAQDEKIG
jgi:hypothetical protein